MKLTKTQIKKYLTFLEKNKKYLGFSDWDVLLGLEAKKLGEVYAEVEANILEKTIKIELSEDFLKKTAKEQANILFHELVHGRISAFKKRTEEFIDIEEEHLANDITRGFEKYIGFEL